MAFPGNRTWKLDRTVPAASLTGNPDYDVWLHITESSFPEDALTAGGEYAIANGGADLAVSLDATGDTRLAVHVVRCYIDATPANSRIELWIRYPGITEGADNPLWIWWGSETETLPANADPYGRDDVWNGTTGDGTPPVSWGVYNFDESPSDSSPQIKDASGNGRDIAIVGGSWTRVDGDCGRAWRLDSGTPNLSVNGTTSFSPGTGDFAVLALKTLASTGDVAFNAYGSSSCWTRTYECSLNATTYSWGTEGTGAKAVYWRRSGTRVDATTNLDSYNQIAATWGDAVTNASVTPRVCGATEGVNNELAFCAVLFCAPSLSWYRAWYDSITGESTFFDQTASIEPAAVQAVFTVSPIAVGSEVRYYEQPHPQQWAIDFDGLDVADQDGTYFLFQVMGSGGASDHYAWFDRDDGSTDPAVADRTGHEIDVATGDTDEDIAVAAATVLNAIADLTVTIVGTVVTVTNERDGELEPPADATGAAATGADVDVVALGNDSDDEITGVEESTGTSWGGTVAVTRPRMITIVVIRPGYEPIRLEGYVAQPASALVPVSQRVDLNYSNPA